MDSGGTKHITLGRTTFYTYKVIFLSSVFLGNNNVVGTIKMRFIIVGVKTRGKTYRIHITDVLHVSKLQANLLLMSNFLSNGLKVQFHVNECIVGSAINDVVAIAQCRGNLYQMTFTKGMWNGYNQLRAFTCKRRSDGALAPLTWTFECEECLCTPKHVRDMNLDKTFCPTFTLVGEICTEDKQYAAKLDNDEEMQEWNP